MNQILTTKELNSKQKQELLIADLMELSLTQNEARTYLALLPLESATAGNLVKITGIPDSKIYYHLDSLQKKGLIFLQQGVPRQYIAFSPLEALENLRAKFKREHDNKIALLDRLGKVLMSKYQEHEESLKLAYIIKGKHNVLNHIKRLMEEATSSVLLMMPNVEIYHILERTIKMVHKNVTDLSLGLYHKNISVESLPYKFQPITCECFFLIVDNRALLTISNWKTNHWHAIWTTETSLIEVSQGYFSSPACCPHDMS